MWLEACVCVYSRCLSSKTMRDPFWSSAILLYRSRSLISDTRLHPTVGQQIKIHFFPSRSQEVHASTIKSTFPSSPPPLEELVVPFHWIRDVRSRSNDGINHTNNRISVSRYMYRICLKFPLWSKFTWLKNIVARVKRGNWGTISCERECKYADKLFRGTSGRPRIRDEPFSEISFERLQRSMDLIGNLRDYRGNVDWSNRLVNFQHQFYAFSMKMNRGIFSKNLI